ncbi:hypothetical protein ACRAWD_29695 [Caulobacter segnis]
MPKDAVDWLKSDVGEKKRRAATATRHPRRRARPCRCGWTAGTATPPPANSAC